MLNVSISFANLLMWILVGGLAGWLASLVVRGGGLGLVGDVLVGVIGAFLGGFLLSQVFPSLYAFTGGFTGFSIGSLIVAFIGAVILLLISRLFTGGMRTLAAPTRSAPLRSTVRSGVLVCCGHPRTPSRLLLTDRSHLSASHSPCIRQR